MTPDTLADNRRYNFTIIDNEIIGMGLTPFAGWLYVVLVSHCKQSNVCFPGLRRLQQVANMSRPTLIKAIAELEAAGLITVTRTPETDKEKQTNHYAILPVSKGGVVNDVYQGGKRALPGVVNDVYHKNIDSNDIKEKDIPSLASDDSHQGQDSSNPLQAKDEDTPTEKPTKINREWEYSAAHARYILGKSDVSDHEIIRYIGKKSGGAAPQLAKAYPDSPPDEFAQFLKEHRASIEDTKYLLRSFDSMNARYGEWLAKRAAPKKPVTPESIFGSSELVKLPDWVWEGNE